MSKRDKSKTINMPLVAIGVPVYNGDKYIVEALESISNQTYGNFECHVVNNASTDKTAELVENYIQNDKRFKLHTHSDFVDVVANWNRTVDYITFGAKYYKLLQADDWMFPNFLEETIKIFEKDNSIGVVSSYRLAGTKVDCFGLDICQRNVFHGKDILYRQLTRALDISGDISTLIFAHEHLKKLNFYPRIFTGKYHDDTELFYDICNISNVGFVYQVLSYTRRHPDSLTNTVVYKYNTLHQLNEAVLFRFKGDDKILNNLYKKEREAYAFFYLIQKIKKSKAYEWHKKHIDRWFTTGEYIKGIIKHNFISELILKIANKKLIRTSFKGNY